METNPDQSTQNPQVPSGKGECYKQAYEGIQGLEGRQKQGDSDLVDVALHLIHGTVVTQHSSIRGQRIDHAWIEVSKGGNAVVVDLSSNPPTGMKRSKWVAALEACEEKRYTPEQARLEAQRFSLKPHAGPWHREPQSERFSKT